MSKEGMMVRIKNFFRIEIERKTNFLALAAFLLALASALAQLFGFFRGANPEIFPSPRVVIHSEPSPSGEKFVRFSAVMAYTNATQIGYNATILREILEYKVGDKSFVQVWQRFIQSESKLVNGVLDIAIIEKGIASPFSVISRDSISHETYFSPVRQKCPNNDSKCKDQHFVTLNRFLEMVKDEKEIIFIFLAEVSGRNVFGKKKKPLISSCRVDIDQDFLDRLDERKKDSVRCWESNHRTYNVDLERI